MTVAVTSAELCSATEDARRPVSAELAKRVFLAYGISDPRPGSYEVDYLITPALGGAVDVRNLWPQPYSDGVWNSHVKDALEDHLRRLVCNGQMPLASAQREIANHWIEAYRRHFQTKVPLPHHANFVKDEAWR